MVRVRDILAHLAASVQLYSVQQVSHTTPQRLSSGSSGTPCAMRLPLLHMRRWRQDPTGFAEELRDACHRVGFFNLVAESAESAHFR